jgi:hypothetical protein
MKKIPKNMKIWRTLSKIKSKSKLPDNRVTQHMSIIKTKNDWETPEEILRNARHKYRIFPTLDVAASSKNRLFNNYFGLDHYDKSNRNALSIPWTESFFMNPPYDPDYECLNCHKINSFIRIKTRKKTSKGKPKYITICSNCNGDIKQRKTLHKGVSEWMAKAYKESKENNVDGLCLTFAKTDTKWFHKYVEGKAEVHFIEGRLRFNENKKRSNYPAPYGSMWVIYRSKK